MMGTDELAVRSFAIFKKLQKEIRSTLGTKRKPNRHRLVTADGFDVLEKECAIKFFSGKSLQDVLEHLQTRRFDVLAGADYQLEAWSVLEPSARYYYLRAYLEFLLETLSSRDPDGEYISALFHQLYQTVFMYGTDAYSDKQKELLRNTAAVTLDAVKYSEAVEEWSDDNAEDINFFLAELERHD